MSVAIIRGLLLGGLGWILWDKLGIMGLAAMPLAVLFLLFWNQDSLLYVPRKGEYTQRPHQVKPLDNYEELTLVGMDGTKITAWLIKQHARGSDARSYTTSPTIIFLHGNGGQMGDRLVNIRGLFACTGCNVLMVEYRGYGTSTGEPSEDGLKLDAQAALDYLHERDDIDSRQIFAFGRSLGGAVAIWLGHRNPRGLQGLMVENSFTSICEMALPIFPFLQVIPEKVLDMLLSSHWDSASIIGELTMPVLFLAGESDEVVPHEQMLTLHEAHRDGCGAGGDPVEIHNRLGGDLSGGDGTPKKKRPRGGAAAGAAGGGGEGPERSMLVTFAGGRHNETWMLSEYYGHIEAWLGTFPKPPLADKDGGS